MAGVKLYEELKDLRGKDKYPGKELEEYLVNKAFPKTALELTLALSNVTAGFYGFTLKHVGQQCGWDKVDSVSKSVFRELGQLKTKETLESGIEIPRDSRSLAVVFISAVYNASPEFNFESLKYTPEETVLRIFGVSRYDRIAKKLDIEGRLSWPVLTSFFEGIAQQMGIDCKVEMEVKKFEEDGRCDYLAKFTLV
jgi:hypothetical protein